MKINFEPDNQIEISQDQKPRLLKKSQLGKKTVLSTSNKMVIRGSNNINVNLKSQDNDNKDTNNGIIVVEEVKTTLNKNSKDNSSDFLIKTILKSYYWSTWKKKVKAMKYYARGNNPKRANFKKLIKQISSVINQHKYDYFNEIYENMKNMPMPNDVKHDDNFGKLRIVNKEVLLKKYGNKMKIWAGENYGNRINGFKFYLIEAFKKMGENKKINEQINMNDNNKETDFSNYERYVQDPQYQNQDFVQNIDDNTQNMEENREYMDDLYNNKENNNINNNIYLQPNINNINQYTDDYYYNNRNDENDMNAHNNMVQPNTNRLLYLKKDFYTNNNINYDNNEILKGGNEPQIIDDNEYKKILV